MGADHFEIACINGEKLILHGWRADQSTVERELTDEEVKRVEALQLKLQIAMDQLLRELAA